MTRSPDALFSNDALYTHEEMPLAEAWVVLPPDAIVEPEPSDAEDAYYIPGLHRIVACSAGTPPEEMVRTQDSRGYDVDTPTEWLKLPEETAPFRAYSPTDRREGEMGVTFASSAEALPDFTPHLVDKQLLQLTMDVSELPLLLILTLSMDKLGEAYGKSLHAYRIRLSYPAAMARPNLSLSSSSELPVHLRGISLLLRTFRKAGLTCTLDPGFWGLSSWGPIPLRGVAGDLPLIERYSRGLA